MQPANSSNVDEIFYTGLDLHEIDDSLYLLGYKLVRFGAPDSIPARKEVWQPIIYSRRRLDKLQLLRHFKIVYHYEAVDVSRPFSLIEEVKKYHPADNTHAIKFHGTNKKDLDKLIKALQPVTMP